MVNAFVEHATGAVTLPDLEATPTTVVTDAAGRPLTWIATDDGLRVELRDPASAADPAPGPRAIACRDVVARIA